MDKKHLEIALSKLKIPEDPKRYWEQYSIPSNIAADILNLAKLSGDIEGRKIFDLGCGTGRLAIGAALMGAGEVLGVDIDKESVEVARENAETVGVEVEFVCEDIRDFRGECDTVVQNPPFGMRGRKHADRIFLEKALECVVKGGRVYSLHRGRYEGDKESKMREFLVKFTKKNGGKVEGIKEYKFDIPYMFKFHKKPKVSYNVDLLVIEKV